MHLDLYLISMAEFYANGRYTHHVANMVAAYKGSYNMALDTGAQQDVDLFLEAERDLQAFVNKRKLERFDKDDYI